MTNARCSNAFQVRSAPDAKGVRSFGRLPWNWRRGKKSAALMLLLLGFAPISFQVPSRNTT